jgi:Ca2+-binding RTX toxin-like protein
VFVIFGKKDNTAVNLSTIGTGGFAINGENANDFSGVSVSTAGDVNGDGMDDLIVGAWGSSLGDKLNVGRSYVVFGKTIKSSKPSPLTSPAVETEIPFKSSAFLPLITKPPMPEIFVAGVGNDTLIGHGSMDVLNAGAGNDTIIINAGNIAALERTGN